MACLRITVEDDGHEIHGATERVSDLPGGAARLVDSAVALECLKQQAVPALEAEVLLLAQHQCVAEGKKGAACTVM